MTFKIMPLHDRPEKHQLSVICLTERRYILSVFVLEPLRESPALGASHQNVFLGLNHFVFD